MNEIVTTPALTPEEDTFCLALIEYAGNLPAAYRAAFGEDAGRPLANAQLMLARPEVAKRVAYLSSMVEEHNFVSLGSHLTQLAKIRDLSIDTKQLKTALDAEVNRGKAAGFYNGKAPGPIGSDPNDNTRPAVHIHIGSSTPVSVQEWGARHGKPPIVIENGS